MSTTLGIIPAHAGLTLFCFRVFCPPWDHPRACGAHLLLLTSCRPPQGSSPRMRGSLSQMEDSADEMGIIPAHAGLTWLAIRLTDVAWDHPRACGAHSRTFWPVVRTKGSSPRMRGSQWDGCHWDAPDGIIPAHAGLTILKTSYKLTTRDHPRACGAHARDIAESNNYEGSSPRMRGSLL